MPLDGSVDRSNSEQAVISHELQSRGDGGGVVGYVPKGKFSSDWTNKRALAAAED